MNFIETLNLKNELELITDKLSNKLNSFPRNSGGLVSEEVRLSEEYRTLKSEFSKAFNQQRKVAQYGNKTFKKEFRAYSQAKRMKKESEFLKQFN